VKGGRELPMRNRVISRRAWNRSPLEDKPLAASPRLSRRCTPMDWERRTLLPFAKAGPTETLSSSSLRGSSTSGNWGRLAPLYGNA
jgi:hypothetical protein